VWAGCAVRQVWKDSLIAPLLQRSQRSKKDNEAARYFQDKEMVESIKVDFIKKNVVEESKGVSASLTTMCPHCCP